MARSTLERKKAQTFDSTSSQFKGVLLSETSLPLKPDGKNSTSYENFLGNPYISANLQKLDSEPGDYIEAMNDEDSEITQWLAKVKDNTSSPITRARSLSPTSNHPVQETRTIQVNYDPVTCNKRINQYEILRELGRGCHGKVKLGRDIIKDELVAIKIVHKTSRRKLGSQNYSSQMDKIHREIAILKKCRHPHVVQLKEVIDEPSSRKIYLILEYMDRGEIQFVGSDGQSPIHDMPTIRHILRNVIIGLDYLHQQGIIHRDIKPANLLWSHDGHVTISDFGVSFCRRTITTISPYTSREESDYSTSSEVPSSPDRARPPQELELAMTAGSPAFFAPELCWSGESGTNRPSITGAIDVWALGITLFCLVYGHPPFIAESEYDLFELIPRAPLEIPKDCHPDLKDFLARLLDKNPATRLTLAEAKSHPWVLAGLADPVAWLMKADPNYYPQLKVTEEEVRQAVTVKNKLRWHLRRFCEAVRTFGKR